VTKISDGLFYNCWSLKSVNIPSAVTSIGRQAFYKCVALTSIDIPSAVKSIGQGAFSYCKKLTSVTVPNSVTAIDQETFMDCTGLTSVTIGKSVTSIGSKAFNQCEVLVDVTCLAVTPPVISDETCFHPAYSIATLHVPEQSVGVYKTTPYWIRFSSIKGDAEDENPSGDSDYMKCDVNGDGEVTIADVNKVIDAILTH
jgi:hypothetical protein